LQVNQHIPLTQHPPVQAQEQDALSDADFESDEEGDDQEEDDEDSGSGGRPTKKRRS